MFPQAVSFLAAYACTLNISEFNSSDLCRKTSAHTETAEPLQRPDRSIRVSGTYSCLSSPRLILTGSPKTQACVCDQTQASMTQQAFQLSCFRWNLPGCNSLQGEAPSPGVPQQKPIAGSLSSRRRRRPCKCCTQTGAPGNARRLHWEPAQTTRGGEGAAALPAGKGTALGMRSRKLLCSAFTGGVLGPGPVRPQPHRTRQVRGRQCG